MSTISASCFVSIMSSNFLAMLSTLALSAIWVGSERYKTCSPSPSRVAILPVCQCATHQQRPACSTLACALEGTRRALAQVSRTASDSEVVQLRQQLVDNLMITILAQGENCDWQGAYCRT